MKSTAHLRQFLALAGSGLLAVSSAQAQLTWDANAAGAGQTNGAGAWLGSDQWWDGAANLDWVSGSDAIFGVANTAGGAVTLASPTTVGSLTFNQFTGTYKLGSAGQALTINDGITKNASSGAVTFLGPITLGGAQTWTNNSSSVLSTGRNTNLINNDGFQLTVDGTGSYNLGTINNAEAALTGSGALVKNGTGRLNIGGVNSGFTGTVTINGGVLQVTNNAGALGNGNLTVNGGVLSFYWGTNYNRTLGTGNNQVQILGGESGFAGSGTSGPNINLGTSVMWGALGEGSGATGFFNPGKFILGDEGTGNAASTTFSSGINLNGTTRTILVPAGNNSGLNRTTISAAISNSTGTAGLIKEGGGVLFLTAAPTYNGTTTVSGGRLDLAGLNLNSMGGGVGVRDITIAAGAVVRRNTLDNAFLQRLVETTAEIGVMTGATSNNLDFSGSTGANLPNAFLGNWAGNGAKAEYNGTLTAGSDGYKLGALGSSGLLGIRTALTGNNILTIGQTGSSGIRVNIVAANTHTGETVINTGSKLTLGNNLALQNSALNVGSAGGTFALAAGTNGGRITGETAAASPTFGGLIGSRNLRSVFTNAGGNNESNLANNAITGFTLNVGTGNTHTYSGSIGGFGTDLTTSATTGGNSTLTKTGLGTQILSGAHTYTGPTNVDGGTLLINGSTSSTSLVTVNSGGTLGGTGTISGSVTLNNGAFLSPGASIESLATGSNTWNGGSTFVFEFSTDGSTGAAGTEWDLLAITGSLDLSGASVGNPISFDLITMANAINSGLLAAWDPDTSATWSGFVTTTGGITSYAANLFDIDTTGFQNPLNGSFSVARNGNNLDLVYTAIPEPTAALLGGLGVLLLLRRRR